MTNEEFIKRAHAIDTNSMIVELQRRGYSVKPAAAIRRLILQKEEKWPGAYERTRAIFPRLAIADIRHRLTENDLLLNEAQGPTGSAMDGGASLILRAELRLW